MRIPQTVHMFAVNRTKSTSHVSTFPLSSLAANIFLTLGVLHFSPNSYCKTLRNESSSFSSSSVEEYGTTASSSFSSYSRSAQQQSTQRALPCIAAAFAATKSNATPTPPIVVSVVVFFTPVNAHAPTTTTETAKEQLGRITFQSTALEKVNSELFSLTYGAFLVQLLRDANGDASVREYEYGIRNRSGID